MTKNNPEKFETSLVEFRHTHTRSLISIVGMIHYGEHQYYKRIQHELDERDAAGHLIHYELVKQSEDNQIDFMTKRKLGLVKKGALAVSGAFSELGLLSQKDEIVYHPHWENNDISLEDYIKQTSLRTALKRSIGGMIFGKLLGVLPHNERAEFLATILEKLEEIDSQKRLALTGDIVEGAEAVKGYSGLYDDPITLTKRNEIALQAVDETLRTNPDANIVLMWGQAHILGQAEGLQDRGYIQTDEQKITAITYENMMV